MSKKVSLSFLLAFAMSTLLGQALWAQPNAPLLDGSQTQPPVQAAVPPQGRQPIQNPLPSITPPNPSFFCQAACTPAACVGSQAIFERCRLCPKSPIISGCLAAVAGTTPPAAEKEAAALTPVAACGMLPPPGSFPKAGGSPDDKSTHKDGDDASSRGDGAGDKDKKEDADGDKADGDKAEGDKPEDADGGGAEPADD